MSSARTSILFLGATGKYPLHSVYKPANVDADSLVNLLGYIGGSVLSRLLAHPSAGIFDITALVRNPGKAKLLESKFGLKTVIGALEDLDKIEELSHQSHVVFSCAS